MKKFNMWASGFCACGCFYQCFITHSIEMAIILGLLSIGNFLLGLGEK